MSKQIEKISSQPTSVRLFTDQKKQLAEAAGQLGLSQQDCLRKAIEYGLPRLVWALGKQSFSAPPRLRVNPKQREKKGSGSGGSRAGRPCPLGSRNSAQTENRKLKTSKS